MAWTFRQITGELIRDAHVVAKGYSGWDDGDGVAEPGEGKNDPGAQELRMTGPIPRGKWRVGPPEEHPTAGSLTLRLFPEPGTETFGRGGFLIHGDSRSTPGSASHGCIILPRAVRQMIWDSGDHEIEVVAF